MRRRQRGGAILAQRFQGVRRQFVFDDERDRPDFEAIARPDDEPPLKRSPLERVPLLLCRSSTMTKPVAVEYRRQCIRLTLTDRNADGATATAAHGRDAVRQRHHTPFMATLGDEEKCPFLTPWGDD